MNLTISFVFFIAISVVTAISFTIWGIVWRLQKSDMLKIASRKHVFWEVVCLVAVVYLLFLFVISVCFIFNSAIVINSLLRHGQTGSFDTIDGHTIGMVCFAFASLGSAAGIIFLTKKFLKLFKQKRILEAADDSVE